jgi:hypothetical protein
MKILFMMVVAQFLTLVVFAWFNSVAWIRILALRQQLAVYKRKSKKPMLRNRDRHLRGVLTEFVGRYNHGRVHQGLNGIPDPDPGLAEPKQVGSRPVAIPVLNGLHHDYRLAA